jgi:hypothetical protein
MSRLMLMGGLLFEVAQSAISVCCQGGTLLAVVLGAAGLVPFAHKLGDSAFQRLAGNPEAIDV